MINIAINPNADLDADTRAALDILSHLKYDSELFGSPITLAAIDYRINTYLTSTRGFNRDSIRELLIFICQL